MVLGDDSTYGSWPFISNYPPSSKLTWRSLESSLFAEGNTCSFMVHVPASYVSLLGCIILTILGASSQLASGL